MNDKILFVCTGNTCRSPMAMAIYNAVTNSDDAKSAGLSVMVSSGAAENAKLAVKKFGASLENHKSRQITADDIEKYSLIITMTASQKELLKSVCNSSKIITLAEFAGKKGDVHDPFGGDIALYEYTADMICDYIKSALSEKCGCEFAKNEDLDAIAQLEKDYFTDAWSEGSLKIYLESKKIIVYKEYGKILGYCIFMIAADEGEILRIAVKKEARCKGIGKKLLEEAFCIMKEEGCNEAFLEVRASNKSAIYLYEKTGFENIGVRKNYYKDTNENAILYKLNIKER